MQFGVDMSSWQIGPKFRGIKNIPSGFHMFHMAFENGIPFVISKWFCSGANFFAYSWNPQTEQADQVDDDMLERLKCNQAELEQYLGPFPEDSQWSSLTSHIDTSMELTNLTKSMLKEFDLSNLCAKISNPLGQLQYSYIRFILGHDMDAFDQWRLLMVILTRSYGLFESSRGFFKSFLNVVYAQFSDCPADLFLERNNIIAKNLYDLDIDCEELKNLFKLIKEKFGWEQTGQDEPVFIE